MADSIFTTKSTLIVVSILISIILIGLPIGFIVWFNYDMTYGIGEIVILNDQDFVDKYDCPGSGEIYDPYIIADYIIETSKDYAIYIEGTTKHFLITNCTIQCQKVGIYIKDTAEKTVDIVDNEIQKTSTGWFHLIITYNVPELVLINNNLSCSTNGVSASGIKIDYGHASIIMNNSCSNFETGIEVFRSGDVYFEFNYIESCIDGIILREGDGSDIRNNVLFNNLGYGVKLLLCFGVEVYHNNFIDNAIYAGLDSQGYDDTADYEGFVENSWYNIGLSEGNYWSELLWDDEVLYVIRGNGGRVDHHPLQFPVLI